MQCPCDSQKLIQRAKNVFYIDYSVPVQTVGATFQIGFPMPNTNIKANNAFISLDKMAFVGSGITPSYSVTLQTSIPTASCFSGQVSNSDGTSAVYGDPAQVAYSESFSWNNIEYGTQGKVDGVNYTSNNTDRKVMCANPCGNTYTVSLYSNSAATGIRSLMALQAAEVDIAVLTLRVELIEEPVLI
jgi:hypothetical protein|eukprot:SAG11_NODE_405_length_9736_cov_5.776486_9_plen_187_part_00